MFGDKQAEASSFSKLTEDELKSGCSSSTDMDDNSSSSLQGGTCEVKDEEVTDRVGNAGQYTGTLDTKTRLPHGHGRMLYAAVTIQPEDNSNNKNKQQPKTIPCSYEGQWVQGEWNGNGKLYSKTIKPNEEPQDEQDCYEGGFLGNKKHGDGVLTYADGRVYKGTYECGFMGKGSMTYPHESGSYWGYWNEKGQHHGRGKYQSADGTVYDGEYHYGKREGHGRLTWPDGRWYLGEFSDDEPNGLGLEVLPDGNLSHEGAFYCGKPVKSSSFQYQTASTGKLILYPSSHGRQQRRSLVGPIRLAQCSIAITPRTKSLERDFSITSSMNDSDDGDCNNGFGR